MRLEAWEYGLFVDSNLKFPSPQGKEEKRGILNWKDYNSRYEPHEDRMSYDKNNIFAKILRGDIPCKKIMENDYALAFYDINPQAPVHALVIPKGDYVSFDDFSAKASNEEIVGFYRLAGEVARQTGAVDNGFRLIANAGSNGGQEVPHFHIHILAGRKLGKMVAAA